MQFKKTTFAFRIIFVIMLICLAVIGIYDYIIPESISVFSDNVSLEEIDFPFVSADIRDVTTSENLSDRGYIENRLYSSTSAKAKMFGIVPLKNINIDMFADITLYPGGMPFGVKLYTDGVIVAGISGVDTDEGRKEPAAKSGLKVGDIIKSVNGKTVNTTDEVSSAIEQSGGNKVSLTVIRDGKELTIELLPIFSNSDNMYKAGIWIRDSTAGIGTVTFIVPETNAFAGLGHGICDIDTGKLMPLRKGTVVDVKINGVTKGLVGDPGELKGIFTPGKIGALIGNKMCGVYGLLSNKIDTSHSQPLKIGLKDELKLGSAEIYCTVNEKIDRYTAEIIKIGNPKAEQKNFVIKITDKRLLDTTGGIVQGMSGSPIIQNGKLVGAVTHVLVNDPTKGYGIFIENMLKNMPELMD